ncbi:MAG: sulfatase-like hydrolase/transferase [Planctomycetes bacterium]|nr:sulfatase-like hydrolase/transferase [Planctomycetota bacterium]
MRNVFVLLADGLRADCLSSSAERTFVSRYRGEEIARTPNLDRLLDRGTRFDAAYASGSEPLPSFATLVTGCHPPRHGVRCPCHPLEPDVVTLWEAFAAAGYRTILANPPEGADVLGIARGCESVFHGSDREFFEFLASDPGRPVLVMAYFSDVDIPYLHSEEPPSPGYLDDYLAEIHAFSRRYAIEIDVRPEAEGEPERLAALWRILDANLFSRGLAHPVESQLPLYFKGIAKFDSGRLAGFLKALEGTPASLDAVLAFSSLSAKAVFRPAGAPGDLFLGGTPPVEGATRVPLGLVAPGLPPLARLGTPVGLVDLAPTLAELAGIDLGSGRLQGRSLVRLARGESGEIGRERPCYMEHGLVALEGNYASFLARSRESGSPAPHRCLVGTRALVSGRMKYVEAGDQVRQEDLAVPADEEFVRRLYGRVLARWPAEQEMATWLDRIRREQTDRLGLLGLVLRQAKIENKYRLYDLEADPEERVNLLALDEERFAPIAARLQEALVRITLDLPEGASVSEWTTITPSARLPPDGS